MDPTREVPDCLYAALSIREEIVTHVLWVVINNLQRNEKCSEQ